MAEEQHSVSLRNLYIAMEAVFFRDPHGRLWTSDLYGPQAWTSYLREFDNVTLAVRVQDLDTPAIDAFGPECRVLILPLPFYRGTKELISVITTLVRTLWNASGRMENVLLRLPGPIPSILGICLLIRGKSFNVYLVGDIDEVISTGNFNLLTRLFRLPLRRITKILCRRARAVSYVTQTALQRKYPCGRSARAFSYSDVCIEDRVFAKTPRRVMLGQKIEAIFCGSLSQLYKGLDVLIRAIALLPIYRRDLHITVIGDGIYRERLEQQAKDMGVFEQFTFLGATSRDRVLEAFSTSDLFLMPSRTEGLPRAMIEAMSQGLACIGTRVGGIPELLNDSALVEPENAEMLAARIKSFLEDPDLMNAQAARNLEYSARFSKQKLDAVRQQFLETMRGQPLKEPN